MINLILIVFFSLFIRLILRNNELNNIVENNKKQDENYLLNEFEIWKKSRL